MHYSVNPTSIISTIVPMAICGLSLAAPVQAEEVKMGNLQISDPAWSLVERKETVARLTNGSNGMVLVTAPSSYQGNKELVFSGYLNTIDTQGEADWEIKTGITPHGYDVLYTSEFIEPQGVRMYVVSVALFSGKEVATMTLFDPGYKGKGDLQTSFGNLLSSARFANNPSPQIGQGQNQSLNGFYVAIGAKTGVSVLAQPTVEVGAKGLWMQPDGRYALTESGITGDFDAYCDRYPKNCGRYQIDNGQYTTWRVGSTQNTRLQIYRSETKPFNREGNDLILGKTRYRNIPPVSDFRLNGDYRLLRADSVTEVGNQSRSGYVESIYGFSQDGRFVKGGSVSMFSDFGSSSVLTSGDRQARTGRYQIDGYILTLSYDDGEKETKAFFMLDDVPVIEGNMYEQVN